MPLSVVNTFFRCYSSLNRATVHTCTNETKAIGLIEMNAVLDRDPTSFLGHTSRTYFTSEASYTRVLPFTVFVLYISGISFL
jgi:hypothetical protein